MDKQLAPMSETLSVEKQHVAVIGAGVAGVSAAKALSERGIRVTVFETQARVGGLWVNCYPEAGVQAFKCMYEFPDLAYPDSCPDLPKAADVVAYCEEYVRMHNLETCFRFNTSVLSVARGAAAQTPAAAEAGPGVPARFVVKSRSAETGEEREEAFSFVIIAVGLNSSTPNVPTFESQEAFAGKIVHTKHWRSLDDMQGKRVVVIGSGKSALDAACIISKVATSVTQVQRKREWYVPLKIAGCIPYPVILHQRAVIATLPAYPTLTNRAKVVRSLTFLVRWAALRGAALLLRLQNWGLKTPKTSFEHWALGGTVLLPNKKQFQLMKAGAFQRHIAKVQKLTKDSVVLDDGEVINADVVVLGTGYKPAFESLDKDILANFEIEEDGMWLYRNMINPEEPHMALVGCNCATFTNALTYNLQAAWVASYLAGDMQLPAPEQMQQTIEQFRDNRRRVAPFHQNRGALIQAHTEQYNDYLAHDMGASTAFYGGPFGPLANWSLPVMPHHYADAVKPKARRTGKKLSPPLWFKAVVLGVVAGVCVVVKPQDNARVRSAVEPIAYHSKRLVQNVLRDRKLRKALQVGK